jgi:hypothetical protein
MAEDSKMTDERTLHRHAPGPDRSQQRSSAGASTPIRTTIPLIPIAIAPGDHGLTKDWQRPTQQQSDVEILQSIEHIRRPAVFGTSSPPSGLSGMLRRLAFAGASPTGCTGSS